jgi:DnaK suppressor protein
MDFEHENAYRPSDDEPYMNQRQLGYFRRKLLDWRRELMEVSQETLLKMNRESTAHPDPVDRAMQEADTALELRTRDRYRKLLGKIDDALERINNGTYGYCEEDWRPHRTQAPRSSTGGNLEPGGPVEA